MAEIDRRAMQGLCAYSVIKRVSPKGLRRDAGKQAVVWCDRPVCDHDELLCHEHALAIRFSEPREPPKKRKRDVRGTRSWARRVHFSAGALPACRNVRTRSVVAEVDRVTCRKCLALVSP